MPLGKGTRLGQGDIVLDVHPAPLPKRFIAPPPIFTHICCGQTAGWIKIPLGMEVGFVQSHIVLDGDRALPKGGGTAAPSS